MIPYFIFLKFLSIPVYILEYLETRPNLYTKAVPAEKTWLMQGSQIIAV